MRKALLSLMLCLASILSSFGYEYTDGNGVTWKFWTTTYNGVTGAYIVGVTNCPAQVTVPYFVEYGGVNYEVKWLGEPKLELNTDNAPFYKNTTITKVKLPSCVTSVNTNVFYGCVNLEKINLENCTEVGYRAFYDCSSLTSVDLSECTSVGWDAFYNCTSLTSVDLSVCKEIDRDAFNGCSSLTSIDLPTCTNIGNGAFSGCLSLTSVNIPACTNIARNTFCGCSSLTSIDLSACTNIGVGAFDGCSSLINVELSACTYIGDGAFGRCSSLTSVGDLSACTKIEGNAFQDCSSLVSIGDMPVCESIGAWAFLHCSSLRSVGDLPVCKSIGTSWTFKDCSSLTSIGDLPACESIETWTFYGCSSLASIGDLSACKRIAKQAFYNCSSLTSIGNLSACESIAEEAFYNCSSLTSVGDLSTCESIESGAFDNCSSLTNIGDLTACKSIGLRAFSKYALIKTITLGSSATIANRDAIPACTTILVPNAAVANYRSADVWKDIALRVIPQNVQHDFSVTITKTPNTGSAIKNSIEVLGGNLENVMSLKVAGDINAYDIFIIRNQMPNLHVLDLSNANIRKTANGYCYYSNYTTTDNVIGCFAFYDQVKLTEVKLPKSLTEIDRNAFNECSFLSSVELSEGIKKINDGSFANCRLRTIVIPNGVESIGNNAFYSCALRSIVLPNTVKTIGDGAFNDCGRIKTMTLPSSLTSLGYRTFYNCKSLQEITLPVALKSIERQVFSGCTELRTIKATALDPSSVTMYDDSFEDYASKTLYVPYDDATSWTTTREAYYWNTQWGQFPNKTTWKPNYDYITIDGDYDQDRGTIPGTNINADFGNEAGYILGDKDNASQTFDEVHINKDGDKGGSIISDDTNLTINKLYCDIAVTADKWYFFCFPFDVTLASVEAPGEYVFRLYDGNQRANGTSGWKNLGLEDSYLKAGKGYIFQTNTSGTLRIPVSNPDFNTAAGGGNAYGKNAQLETFSAASNHDASWNFIGNPYLSYYELEDLGHDAPITYWDGSNYVSVRKGDDNYALQPYQAFFVQKTTTADEVEFDKTKRETYKQSQNKAVNAKAARAKSKVNAERLLLNITISDGENTDKTRVVFNDKKQMAYETECDATKFMSSEAVPQVYTTYGDVAYAINERPNGSGEVQLCFKTPKAGTYTIGMSRMDTPMLLKDAETGQVFDFANGSYSFEAEEGTNTTRFLLVKNSSTTAIHPTTVGEAESVSFFNLAGQQTTASAKGVKIVRHTNGDSKKMLTR